jgi:gliding motility-associated-like protein
MKKVTSFLCILFIVLIPIDRALAQIDCAPNGSIKLADVKDYCSGKAAENNTNVTPNTTGGIPNCWNPNSKNDVWYKFTAIASDVYVNVIKGGTNGTIKNVNIAFYSMCSMIDQCKVGTAADTLSLYQGGLQIGNTYFIRISSTASDAGTYTLCVKNVVPVLNPAADCDNAVRLCTKASVSQSGLSGPGNNDKEVETTSCFHTTGSSAQFIEQNSFWYYWVCGKAGTLTFDLIPSDPLGDIDFIVYEVSSTDICKNRTILRCSGAQCLLGKTGLNMSETDVSEVFSTGKDCNTVKNEYVKYIDMEVGKTYALLINNAIGTSGFSINFGGTGEFQIPVAAITADKLSICEGESVTFSSNSTNADSLIWNLGAGALPTTVPKTAGPHVITYNTSGNFTVTLIAKSVGGCYSTDIKNINVNVVPTVTVDSKDICEGEEATLTATPSVGGGTYSWNPGMSTTNTLKDSPISDQAYTVTYNLAGCEAKGMGTITVNKKPEVTVNSEDICAGGDAVLTATLKETAGIYTYAWAPGGGTTKSITVNPTTQTVYTVTVTSAQGCIGIGTGTVNVNGTLSVNAGNDTLICEGTTISLIAKPTVANYTYKWTASMGVVSNDAIYNPTVTPTETTTYTVTVTSDKGCTGSDIVIVSIDPLMVPTVTATNISCNGACDGKVNVNITGGTAPYTYSWSGSLCDQPACTALCSGTYAVTVKDKIGCAVSGNTTVTEPTALSLQTTHTPSVCGQPTGTASVVASGGTPGYTYEWDDAAKQTTATATGLASKKYCVNVTDASGCIKTACVDVTDKPGFTASVVAITSVSCNGLCDGTAEVIATGGTPPFTYTWNTTPGAQTNAKATGLCAGNYIATIKDATGCMATIQVEILQPPPIVLDPVPAITLCIGSNATLNAVGHGGDGNYTYSWLPESTETTPSITVSPLVSTAYHVVIRDGRGCASAPLVIQVNVNPPLTVTASADVSICQNDSTLLSAAGNGGNGGPYSYTWSPGMQTGNSIAVKPLTSTTYTVTIKDNCGTPVAQDSVKVTVNALPIISFSADTLEGCNPLTVNFTDSSIAPGAIITSWKWEFGDKSGSDSKDPTHVFTTNGGSTTVYTITLTVKSSNGCVSTFKKKDWVRVFPVPVANFEAPVSNSILNPTIQFTNTSLGATSWTWDFDDSLSAPDNNTSDLYSPSHTYADIGDYCVKLVVKNAGGCTSEVTNCITIDPQFVLYIPNGFTPNDDGDNDKFTAYGEYINEFEMRIFDRWGIMVYYTDSMDKPWNGKRNNLGETLQQDVYVYQITIRDNKSKRHKYVGKITLLTGG